VKSPPFQDADGAIPTDRMRRGPVLEEERRSTSSPSQVSRPGFVKESSPRRSRFEE